MRITNQMMQNTAKRTGNPLQQNTLLDIMNKSSSSTGGMLPSVGTLNECGNDQKQYECIFGEDQQ